MIPAGIQRPRARLDLLEQFVYIAEESDVTIAQRYLKAVAETCSLLKRHPEAGSPYDSGIPGLGGLRRFRVKGFEKYLVFYVSRRRGIDVIRVLHGARDIGSVLMEEN